MFNFLQKNNRGFSLVETIFYIAILAVFSVLIINALIGMTQAFKEVRLNKALSQGASIMEFMSRELRQASGILSVGGTSIDFRTTNPVDALVVEKIFSLSGSDISFREGGVDLGTINPSNVSVDSLSFAEITTTQGKAVRMYFTISVIGDASGRTADFYSTVILRGAY